ncbi:MAG: HlyD family efflux transporter periplasmic adaptor subunit [Gemmatimonadetes bacterium]|nr:HlyD family efflux transporter periplasmic adaptor subunit [Gemmatimonadota bacterium]
MSSALESRPKLKDDVTIVRRENRGRVHYIVKEPRAQKYFQFREIEVGLMRLMNGERTPTEIADAAGRELGVTPPAGQVADFAQKLKRLGLVERTPAEQHLMAMERLRSERKTRARRRTRGSILRLRFSLGDPDHLFDRFVERFSWFWSPTFVWISIGLFVAYFAVTALRWDAFWSGVAGLYTLRGFGIWDLVLFYVLMLVLGVIHELGHGLTTKALGGEVHEMGGMLLYFSPALYCNTNDAWTFERRSHRLWVSFAGPWIELLIAAAAAIVWVVTDPATFINELAFLTVLAAGLLSLLTNFNPLLPLDGYYVLSDWLEIPNLRRRSFEYMGWLAKRYLLGLRVAPPAATPRERRVFIIYGVLAFFYSLVVAVVSALWLVLVLGRFLGPWVWALLIIMVLGSGRRLFRRSEALATAAATTWRAGFLGNRRTAVILAVVAALVVVTLLMPWTFRARGPLRVEPAPRAQVRAEVAGILDRWYAEEGDTVEAGAPIARLWNPGLEARAAARRAEAQRLELQRARAETRGDRAAAAAAAASLSEVRADLDLLEAQLERLTVRAPVDGVVLGYRLDERQGEALDEGTQLVEVASLDGRLARVRVRPKEAGAVERGQTVKLKIAARPDVKFVAAVTSVAAAAAAGWLEVEVALPDSGWLPPPGTTGIAKIETGRGTIAEAIVRAFKQTVRLDLWL